MIIDLDPVELNMSIQQYHDLQSKVHSAMQLLVSSNLVSAAPTGGSGTPSGAKDASSTSAEGHKAEVAV